MGRSWKVEPAVTVTLPKKSILARVCCLSTSPHSRCICQEREEAVYTPKGRMSVKLMGDQRGHPSGGGVFGWTSGGQPGKVAWMA